jgi:hypothetical protein
MGLLDNVLGSVVSQGNLSKPLMIALTALLTSPATGGGGRQFVWRRLSVHRT